jgi:hypothetical protein
MKAFRTLFLIFLLISFGKDCIAQANPDTPVVKTDSSVAKTDSLRSSDSPTTIKPQANTLDYFLKKNKYLNVEPAPVSLAAKEKTKAGKEFLFYLLSIVILLLALVKVFYTKYFNNIFRVFFNTSLRQNQLTDLLLQAKLPSLIFNIFFVISSGLYAWLVLDHYRLIKGNNNYILIGLSILFVAIVYFGKFLSLKIIGWISGMSIAIDQYIFVIFLINKIIGILLIPFIILLAFAPANWISFIIILSFFIIGILFLLRYLRSYGLLQNELRINGFHFLLYIIGMELLPILLIYKLVDKVFL